MAWGFPNIAAISTQRRSRSDAKSIASRASEALSRGRAGDPFVWQCRVRPRLSPLAPRSAAQKSNRSFFSDVERLGFVECCIDLTSAVTMSPFEPAVEIRDLRVTG
jgi:hypothetical protein